MKQKDILYHLFLATMLCLVALPAWGGSNKKTQERPLRVACVGNSVTYGYGLRHRDRDAYPVRLQQMLDSVYGAYRRALRLAGLHRS